jgi:hypothetical protein
MRLRLNYASVVVSGIEQCQIEASSRRIALYTDRQHCAVGAEDGLANEGLAGNLADCRR